MKSTLRFLKICSLSALLVSPTGLMAQPANPVAITQPMMLSMNVTRKPVENVLESLGRKTGLDVHFDRNEVNADKLVSINCKNQPVKEVLASISDQTGLRFEVFNNKLIVSAAEGLTAEAAKITGTVKDASGQPLVGVSVHIKGTTTGGQTNASGIFVIDAKPGDVLVFSYIGYIPQEVTVGNDANITITLATDSKSLQEVVVTAFGIKGQKSHSLTLRKG
ncbi:Secretin and TonB N terminus short domain-containing protein [Mucilaginibacter pineti]|uniref:Secretin and TonB N terminus short domain-containing protein n=1 Tax=Mucilaginibacter pineti TaxID=1391627 RepID=A0A1G7FXM3_9SPHI|nr:STN domain-containing protein [Mucilaginibacter pineti]SDE80601.1 Secretin and TonB N terminus short domain-containing protein [Mucilaginibacter pineti]